MQSSNILILGCYVTDRSLQSCRLYMTVFYSALLCSAVVLCCVHMLAANISRHHPRRACSRVPALKHPRRCLNHAQPTLSGFSPRRPKIYYCRSPKENDLIKTTRKDETGPTTTMHRAIVSCEQMFAGFILFILFFLLVCFPFLKGFNHMRVFIYNKCQNNWKLYKFSDVLYFFISSMNAESVCMYRIPFSMVISTRVAYYANR